MILAKFSRIEWKDNCPIKTVGVKERFNNTTNTKDGTDGQKLKRIKTDYEMGFWKKKG